MQDTLNILVTGANGFMAGALLKELLGHADYQVAAALRTDPAPVGCPAFIVGELSQATDWTEALADRQVVVHLAARAHMIRETGSDSLAEYRRVNVDATLKLARQAAAAGVRRFLFISSIGVNGNGNSRPFTEKDAPNPAEPYAQSKWEAEQGLWQIQQETGMELVIIRPPLVYGPNAPGNFGSLVRWVEKGVPLPLGAIRNKRSLVALDNLIDLIQTCIRHPQAVNQVFLAGDGVDLSTTALLRMVAHTLNKEARLVPVPPIMLQCGAMLLGKSAMAKRLLGSLQVDISKARTLLDWTPPLTVEEGLRRCMVERSQCDKTA